MTMRIESNSIITVCLIAPFSPPEDKIVQFKCVRVTPVSRVQYATAPPSLVNVTFLLLRDGLLHSEPRRHHRWITPSLSTTPIISYCDPRSLETIQINSSLVVVSSAPSTTAAPPPPDVRAASLEEERRSENIEERSRKCARTLTWLIGSGRLSLVLLSHLADLQLQTLLRRENVTVQHLKGGREGLITCPKDKKMQ